MKDYVKITDVFENALNSLHELNPIERSIASKNIAELEYIDEFINTKNSKKNFERLINQFASDIYRKDIPVDIMQLSAIIYKGRKAGFNVTRLENAMNNNGEWLMSEQSKAMSKKFYN